MKNSLLFIGRVNSRNTCGNDGVIIRNRVFVDTVIPYFERLKVIDLDIFRNPKTIHSLIMALWFWRYRTIVVGGGGSVSFCRLVSLVRLISPPLWFGYSKLFVLGTGGNMSLYFKRESERSEDSMSLCGCYV